MIQSPQSLLPLLEEAFRAVQRMVEQWKQFLERLPQLKEFLTRIPRWPRAENKGESDYRPRFVARVPRVAKRGSPCRRFRSCFRARDGPELILFPSFNLPRDYTLSYL
jgi:hypothetical protein